MHLCTEQITAVRSIEFNVTLSGSSPVAQRLLDYMGDRIQDEKGTQQGLSVHLSISEENK